MSNIPFDSNKAYVLSAGVGNRDVDSPAMAITARDAGKISKELIGRAHFLPANVQTLINEDATCAGLLGKLEGLAVKTSAVPAEMVVIYFSGHGCIKDEKYYIVCRDTINTDIAGTAIAGSVFVEKLQAIQTDKMLVLLDCCHSGGIYNSPDAGNEYKSTDVPFEKEIILAKPNRVIISASHASEVSFVSKPLSIFTYALVEGLAGKFFEDGDTDVTLFNLAMYLRERVYPLSENRQRPQLNIVQNAATIDFAIARYPNGEPRPAAFDEDFSLWTDGGKEVNTGMPVVKDEEFRRQFNWITAGGNVIIQHASQINNFFGNFDENRPLNQYLTKVLINSIDNDMANKFEKDNEGRKDWYLQSEKCIDAQLIIMGSYSNVIGIQLIKLMSIGTEEFSAKVGIRYTDRCLATARTIFQLLDFALISDLWNRKKNNEFSQLPDESKIIQSFFDYDKISDGGVSFYITVFRALVEIYSKLALSFPVTELNTLGDKLKQGGEFYNACNKLIELQNVNDDDKSSYSNCLATEKNLADVMAVMGFLSAYKMVSVKSVSYEQLRGASANYLHSYTEIRSGNKATNPSNGLRYFANPVNTDAILFYRENYLQGINLFPFILDYNALILESGVKTCLWTAKYTTTVTDSFDDSKTFTETMRFTFLEDDNPQEISYHGILKQGKKINDLLNDKQGLLQIKFDTVYLQLMDAKDTLLGTNTAANTGG